MDFVRREEPGGSVMDHDVVEKQWDTVRVTISASGEFGLRASRVLE